MPKRRRCCSSRNRIGSSALLGAIFVALACDGQFAFDGGTASADCEARCQTVQLTCLASGQLCVECVQDADCAALGGGRCGVSGQTANRCLGCLSDDDCAVGEECEPGTHSCVTQCDHFGDSVCAAGGLECNPRRGYCAACFDADDCDPVSLRCSEGDARCVECVYDEECATAPGKWCDPVALRCVACRDSRDCPVSNPTCDPSAHVCH